MEEYLIYLVIFCVGVYVGFHICIKMVNWYIKKENERDILSTPRISKFRERLNNAMKESQKNKKQ